MTETLKILNDLNIDYKHVVHEPITNYEIALKIDRENNLTGIESKNLFLISKTNNKYVLVTTIGTKFVRSVFNELLNEKLNIASPAELNQFTGYQVGSVPGFPFSKDVTYIIDVGILKHQKYICSSGIPTESYELYSKDVFKVYKNVQNKVLYIDFEKNAFVKCPI